MKAIDKLLRGETVWTPDLRSEVEAVLAECARLTAENEALRNAAEYWKTLSVDAIQEIERRKKAALCGNGEG